MDLNSLMRGAILSDNITQYPDKQLLRAAILLNPEERPTVPVRLYDDPLPVYQEIYQQLGLPYKGKGNPNARAVTVPNKDKIYVRQGTEEYNNLYELAAALAHEQVHVRQPRNDPEESEPYAKQLEVINRYATHVPRDVRKLYQSRAESAARTRQQQLSKK